MARSLSCLPRLSRRHSPGSDCPLGSEGVVGSGTRGAVLQPLARLLLGGRGEWHVLGLLYEPIEVLQVEVHELLKRWVLLQGLRAHVDKERPCERVLARLGCLWARCDPFDGERL